MGQYWIPVNLDKKEFIHPHRLGAGLKLWEQLAAHPGTGAALIMLCAAMPEPRGGGDLRSGLPNVVGRWAGDRIALVGDYAENSDLSEEWEASKIYDRCQAETKQLTNDSPDEPNRCSYMDAAGRYVHYIEVAPPQYRDITEMVCAVIEKELDGHYEGDGWRDWKENAA